jgi:integrase
MKNTNIVISLDTRKQKKDNTYPLVLRLGHIDRTTSIPLNISLLIKDWDEEKRVVKKSYIGTESVTRLNNRIQKRKAEAMDIIFTLREANELDSLSITALRSKIEKQNCRQSFFQFADGLVQDLYTANQIGNARVYKGVISILKTFCNGKELYFSDITFSFLHKFEVHHKSKGNRANGLSVYMRTIRAIYNKAIKKGVAEKAKYPFGDYKIKNEPTEKRALDWELLKKIIELKLPSHHICFDSRNYFLASYMMYGMNFTDMAYLKKNDIVDGRIVYRRKKTSKIYNIKIIDSLQAILSFYSNQNPKSSYIFPIIKRDTALLQSKDIQWARKRYNKKLKLLGVECGIDKNLTSYVSRHSFATQAMLQLVPLNAISTMLGHSSIKTTEIYLKTLPSNILDDYNSKITSMI